MSTNDAPCQLDKRKLLNLNMYLQGLVLLSAFTLTILGLNSCGGEGGGGSTGGPVVPIVPVVPGTTTFDTGDILALVLDPDGSPVRNASLGGNAASTDSNGVAFGTVTETASGWVELQAQGYATGYAKQAGNALNGKKLFDTRLTPVGDSVIHDMSDDDTLSVSDGTNVITEAVLSAALFAVDEVTVSLADIRPIDVGPLFSPLSNAAVLYLQKAFWLDAKDNDGQTVLFDSGQTVDVNIRDEGALPDDPTMARFNPDTGVWDVVAGPCARLDPSHIQCTLSDFALFGLFDITAPTFSAPSPLQALLTHLLPDPTETAYQNAYANFECEWIATCNAPPNAVDDYAAAAQDYAAVHPNESGKMRLITTQAQIDSFFPTNNIDLMPDAINIWNELVKDLLASDPDCEEIDELKALEAQRQAFLSGYSTTQADALQSKLEELEVKCKVRWEGTVYYNFLLEDTWPGLPSYEIWPSSPRMWQETHHISMAAEIDPVTGALTGNIDGHDFVDVTLLELMYRWDLGDNSCGPNHSDIEMPQMATGVGGFAPVNTLFFDFTGTYDGTSFTVGTILLDTTNSSTIVINRRQYTEFWNENPSCVQIVDDEQLSTPVSSYKGMLAGGFTTSGPDSPNLETMLNSGTVTTDGDVVTISGKQTITVTLPPGIYPFTKASVSWQFKNVATN